jgi:hypothetical protein
MGWRLPRQQASNGVHPKARWSAFAKVLVSTWYEEH